MKGDTDGHLSCQFWDRNELCFRLKAKLDGRLRSEGADDPINCRMCCSDKLRVLGAKGI